MFSTFLFLLPLLVMCYAPGTVLGLCFRSTLYHHFGIQELLREIGHLGVGIDIRHSAELSFSFRAASSNCTAGKSKLREDGKL